MRHCKWSSENCLKLPPRKWEVQSIHLMIHWFVWCFTPYLSIFPFNDFCQHWQKQTKQRTPTTISRMLTQNQLTHWPEACRSLHCTKKCTSQAMSLLQWITLQQLITMAACTKCNLFLNYSWKTFHTNVNLHTWGMDSWSEESLQSWSISSGKRIWVKNQKENRLNHNIVFMIFFHSGLLSLKRKSESKSHPSLKRNVLYLTMTFLVKQLKYLFICV